MGGASLNNVAGLSGRVAAALDAKGIKTVAQLAGADANVVKSALLDSGLASSASDIAGLTALAKTLNRL